MPSTTTRSGHRDTPHQGLSMSAPSNPLGSSHSRGCDYGAISESALGWLSLISKQSRSTPPSCDFLGAMPVSDVEEITWQRNSSSFQTSSERTQLRSLGCSSIAMVIEPPVRLPLSSRTWTDFAHLRENDDSTAADGNSGNSMQEHVERKLCLVVPAQLPASGQHSLSKRNKRLENSRLRLAQKGSVLVDNLLAFIH